ncbi:DUF4105 domain-containing protein [Coralloluteibacterium stylophorae]|uniref:DUF4105 domain-containing protein n=1 Tax=Coralloluteibacterium stylophorae TaxID=1776034 RepID=A0A8J8AYE2_9GAMM|nr:DUF4105 domain-containing protein [Coralloluteibacterium stylophorae]MBS7456687.1 DUF4105 domain-containing protein [Coralloluteibacterium stylophorae]
MPRIRPALRIVLLVLLCLAASLAQARVRIGVATMAPGEEYWSRFGHNAVVVDDPSAGGPLMYNYGFFDFEEPGFLVNFLKGKMEYLLVALPAEEDLLNYAYEGRGVRLQWLDIEPEAAAGLAQFLAWNAQPENARYRYDYFTDNCSTKVRDAIDRALGGLLEARLDDAPRTTTYRSEALRLGQPTAWLALGMHFGLGPYADRPLTRWDESFVPSRLHDALREATTPRGTPLVLEEVELVPHRIAPEPAAPPQWLWRFLGVGLVVAALILLLRARAPRAIAAAAAAYWAVAGLAGLWLAALWGLTDHVAGWSNANLLLASPLALALVPGALVRARGRAAGAAFATALALVTLMAVAAAVLAATPWGVQDNVDWIALLLPVQLAFDVALRRPR